MSTTAFASVTFNSDEVLKSGNSYIERIDDGVLFIQRAEDKDAVIMTDDSKNLIAISIKYRGEENQIYQWIIEDYPVSKFPTLQNSNWLDVIEYAEKHVVDAELIEISDETDRNSVKLYQTESGILRSSMSKDIRAQLRNIYGNEYSKALKYTRTLGGQTFRVYEDMEFRIWNTDAKSWAKTMTVASIIATILSISSTTALINAICNAFGVAVSAKSLIPKGGVKIIECGTMLCRYVTANGTSYNYNATFKYYDYKAYEDRDTNSDVGAFIDTSSLKVNYQEGSAHFNSYSAQVEKAYEMFKKIGQK